MTPSRIFDFIYYQQQHTPLERAFSYRPEGEEWVHFSTGQIIELANYVSRGLIRLGVRPGDKIALVVYQNRPEWTIVDIAIQQIGAINVPVYPTISPAEYEYIFNDAGVVYCFAGRGDLYDKVSAARTRVPSLRGIYTFDEHPGRPFWREMFADEGQDEVDRRREQVLPDELATIIYTSGTTGHPKGVMLSHRNIVSNVLSVEEVFPLASGDRVLSFLPLCHIFERTGAYYYTYRGIEVYFAGTDNLGGEKGDILAVRPHGFSTVPRLLEKVYEKIYNRGLSLRGLTRRIFFWALALTDDFEYDRQYHGLAALQRKLADRLVFSKWRAALGGNVKGIITGAAPCPVKIARIFSAAGIPIREGYGLTETSPGLAIGRFTPGGARLGTVGPAVPGVELRIDTEGDYRPGEGEILAKGPNVMMGYYGKPAETAEVFVDIGGERWFRTGDVGTLVPGPEGQAFLQITDRKKELLKTSGGKYVAPAPIESKLKEDFLIEQAMIIGDQRKFVSALIIPAAEPLREWCRERGIPNASLADMVRHEDVVRQYDSIVRQVNQHFGHTEQVKKFRLLDTEWGPTKPAGEDAELTPTLKLKRRVILQKFAGEIEEMYG